MIGSAFIRKFGLQNNYSIDLEASSSQYATITDAAQTGLNWAGDFTVEGYFRPESLSGAYMTLASRYTVTGNQRSWWLAYRPVAETVALIVSNDGSATEELSVAYTLSTATWYHIAAAWDASAATFELFINGVSQGTDTGVITSLHDSTGTIDIGRINNATPYYFDGLINNLRFWDTLRNVTDINNNKDKVITSHANLKGSWYSKNNNHQDLTANGNDLTAVNAPVFSSTTPF